MTRATPEPNDESLFSLSRSAWGAVVAPVSPIQRRSIMSGQGSAGNVIAALCSFFIPGLGLLIQGRLLMAIFQFCLAAVLWFFLLGWLVHLWSILDAAWWKPKLA